MMQWWQNLPSQINPVMLAIGSFEIRWYGMMYLFAFASVYILVRHRLKSEQALLSVAQLDDLMSGAILGVLIGGRLGYVVFYNFLYYLSNPLEAFLPFSFNNGIQYVGFYGMSYHGGLLGSVVAFILFARKYKISVWRLADLFIPAVPLGYFFGRLGNFINGELYGRVTNAVWGMFFPLDVTQQLRHPSQLYEALGEGILLFVILWSIRRHKFFHNQLFAVYLIGYGVIRFVIEFFRQPDEQLGILWWNMSMGQWLCLGMVACGMVVWWINFNLIKKQKI